MNEATRCCVEIRAAAAMVHHRRFFSSGCLVGIFSSPYASEYPLCFEVHNRVERTFRFAKTVTYVTDDSRHCLRSHLYIVLVPVFCFMFCFIVSPSAHRDAITLDHDVIFFDAIQPTRVQYQYWCHAMKPHYSNNNLRFLIFLWLVGLLSTATTQALSITPASSPSSSSSSPASSSGNRIVILGGTGRIGTAVAIHLLQRDPQCHVVLVGRRRRRRRQAAAAAVSEVLRDSQADASRVSTEFLENIWKKDSDDEDYDDDDDDAVFQALVDQADCLIHTAGPYLDQKPIPLQRVLQERRSSSKNCKCRAYVDVSDPLPYLEESLLKTHEAQQSNVTALVAAGAFPGLSNVLAQEAAQYHPNTTSTSTTGTGSSSSSSNKRVQDVRFQYFTAGLGGSGVVNLYITNLGFGEPMVQYDEGQLRFFTALSGLLLGKVDFFLPQHLLHTTTTTSSSSSNSSNLEHAGNARAKERVGTQTVFAWPFPEAATVATNLKARGNSYAAMGTAPDLWNTMLGILVNLVPRPWWKNPRFSKFMADFSQPMVWATDKLLQQTGVGETHAMRVDVTFVPSSPREKPTGVSIVQAHDSFRSCVGQSCAEFALDILNHPRPGVYVPEQFYQDATDRSRIIDKLTSTPGTFCYTGPVAMPVAPDPPEGWGKAISQANNAEAQ